MLLIKLEICMQKNVNKFTYLSLFTKPKTKLLKNLNIKQDKLNLIDEKVGNALEHIGTEGGFLNRAPMAQLLRLKLINRTS